MSSDESFALEDTLSPPMANGEVVFEAPWQGRVFGMARSLCEQGLYSWDEFREQLIKAIAEDDQRRSGESGYQYFDCFMTALLVLLESRSLVDKTELDDLERALRARPHGHDHHHH